MNTLIGNSITEAASYLHNHQVVAIPTETVYGLAGNALSEVAILAIYAAKRRPQFNPLIVHCASWVQAANYVTHIPAIMLQLIKAYSPGPITFLLPKLSNIPYLVTSGSNYVAIRVPNHPITLQLLQQLPFPLAAPSANEYGYISPTTASHVLSSLGGRIPYILDGNSSNIGIESTIVGCDEAESKILVYRQGGISISQIEAVVNQPIHIVNTASNKPLTAGQQLSHYAPRKPLYVGDVSQLASIYKGKKIAIISLNTHYTFGTTYILSATGNINEAAQNLFATLHTIDVTDAEIIIAEIVDSAGIGAAINDRLQRASYVNKIKQV